MGQVGRETYAIARRKRFMFFVLYVVVKNNYTYRV
jgi:hypothetical protein